MKLRARQQEFVDRCVAALRERGNTLGVAPTGAGKTVMLSAVDRAVRSGDRKLKTVILQHRDELVTQNRRTYEAVNPGVPTSVYNARHKDWSGAVTLAMVQTLARPEHLERMPPVDVLVIDEAHHSAAASYHRLIDAARLRNPDMLLFGVTATPNRGDKRALRHLFDNVADQITLKELIEAGHLVRPRTFVLDLGVGDELRRVKKIGDEFDMDAVAEIMDKEPLNNEVVRHWRAHAGDRPTVVFCATVEHARHVCAAFSAAGVRAGLVFGDMPATERQAVLAAYDRGEMQVICNVAVLTEGWDSPPTSCVVLLRPSSFKSTMIQMIGRGLRKVDPERYPGVRKDDCVVLDFGASIRMHGGIEQDVALSGEGLKTCPDGKGGCGAEVPVQCRECPLCGYAFPPAGEAPVKACPECGHDNHTAVRICAACGHEFEKEPREVITEFVLTEVDLFEDSPYRWTEMFNGLALVATAFEAAAIIVAYAGRWWAFGVNGAGEVRLLADSDARVTALASADDWMREHGDRGARKTKAWLYMPPSEKQLAMLRLPPEAGAQMTRYEAACMIEWRKRERVIRTRLEHAAAAMRQRRAA